MPGNPIDNDRNDRAHEKQGRDDADRRDSVEKQQEPRKERSPQDPPVSDAPGAGQAG